MQRIRPMASSRVAGERRPGTMVQSMPVRALPVALWLLASACGVVKPTGRTEVSIEPKMEDGGGAVARVEEGEPPRPLHQPIPLWKEGKVVGEIDAAAPAPGQIVLDLG